MAKDRTAYWEQVKSVIRACDIILEVVDARFPLESRNFDLENMVITLKKKLVIVVNKIDLVPMDFVKKSVKKLNKEFTTVYLSSHERHGSKSMFNMLNRLKGDEKIKVGVVGYPNTGKSAVINVLRGRHSASTAAKPGHTHGIQWVRISPSVMLMDSPGVVPFKGKRDLFLKGAMSIEKASDAEKVIMEFIEDVVNRGVGNVIVEKYGVELEPVEDFLERFAEKYHLKVKGGFPDTERAAKKIYSDWLRGKLKIFWL